MKGKRSFSYTLDEDMMQGYAVVVWFCGTRLTLNLKLFLVERGPRGSSKLSLTAGVPSILSDYFIPGLFV